MAERKKTKRYPSRDRVKYIPIPVEMWDKLKELGEPDERSVSYMVRKAIRLMLDGPHHPDRD